MLVPAPASSRIASAAHGEAERLRARRARSRQFQQRDLPTEDEDVVVMYSDGKPTVAVAANDRHTVVDTQTLVLDLLHI